MTVRRLTFALTLALCLAAGRAAPASEVRDKVLTFAQEIKRLLEDEGQTQVAVGEFTGPPAPATSAGPMIQVSLIEQLRKIGVGVDENAFVFVKGEYFVLDDNRNPDGLTIRLLVSIKNKKGKKIDELSADIGYRGNEDIVKLLAINTDQADHTKANRERQNEKLKEDLESPPLHLDGAKIQARAGSAFAVEALSRPKGGGQLSLLKPAARKGQAFVEVTRGQEYVLRLTNHSRHEAAVSVTIDGVDAFQFFEPANDRPGTYLVPAGTTREIQGWQRSTEMVSAFLVGSYADSAAAKALKGSARAGTITVCFHPSWEKGKTPPDYQGTKSAAPDATVIWRDIEEKTTVVSREIGPLLAAVSIRYSK